MSARYFEDFAPGHGRAAPRAALDSDAPRIDLNGDWAFRFSPALRPEPDGFEAPDFDDAAWDALPVPRTGSCTATAGPPTPTSATRSRSTRRTSPTRTRPGTTAATFDLPADWPGTAARAALRGRRLLRPGLAQRRRARRHHRQPAAHRVRRRPRCCGRAATCWRSGCTSGRRAATWRTRTCGGCRASSARSRLLARPAGGIDDVFVHADYDAATGAGTLRVDRAARRRTPDRPGAGRRRPPPADERHRSPAVQPWTAETPRLYDATVRHRRRARPAAGRLPHASPSTDGVLKVNGRRVLLRGVNRHESHPDHGRALSAETMLRRRAADEAAQHQRGAHQPLPAAPATSSTCATSSGLWVIDECDLETHGFESDVGWRGNPSDDPRWQRGLPRPDASGRSSGTRTTRASSCGRSATRPATAATSAAMAEWMRAARPGPADPLRGRPDAASTPTSTAGCTPPHAEVERDRRRREDDPPGPTRRSDARAAGMPFLLCEYAPRDGQRARRARRVPASCSRRYPRLPGRLRLGVDRPRAAHPRRRGPRVLRATAATSARTCTTATSSATGWSSPTARRRRGWSSTRR